jgi:hypothetical protein
MGIQGRGKARLGVRCFYPYAKGGSVVAWFHTPEEQDRAYRKAKSETKWRYVKKVTR